jgi:V/A-type H+-transporting ATPase subunit D
MLRVRPTKIELVRLKRRLSLAQRVQKIVKDRLSILTMEFLQIARETVEAKERLVDALTQAYRGVAIATAYHSHTALGKELIASESDSPQVAGGVRNVAGVRIPSFESRDRETPGRGYSMVDTTAWVDHAAQLSEQTVQAIVDLAELQRGLELLGMEINRTKRITNALEHIIIPSLQNTIDYLSMKFEERDREEKARLKRVKVLLERE